VLLTVISESLAEVQVVDQDMAAVVDLVVLQLQLMVVVDTVELLLQLLMAEVLLLPMVEAAMAVEAMAIHLEVVEAANLGGKLPLSDVS